jgi:hypothetical protein
MGRWRADLRAEVAEGLTHSRSVLLFHWRVTEVRPKVSKVAQNGDGILAEFGDSIHRTSRKRQRF